MRLPILIAALSIALAGCGSRQPASAVTVERAYVRLSAVPGQPAAGYATITASPDRGALAGLSSSQAGRIEMHETMSAGSMTSMRPVERIDIRAGEAVLFAPGGRHLMLFDVDRTLKPGDRADLSLHFAHGPPVIVKARVIAAGDDAPY